MCVFGTALIVITDYDQSNLKSQFQFIAVRDRGTWLIRKKGRFAAGGENWDGTLQGGGGHKKIYVGFFWGGIGALVRGCRVAPTRLHHLLPITSDQERLRPAATFLSFSLFHRHRKEGQTLIFF